MQHSFEDGKYTVISDDKGNLKALRHGEPWQDLTGNKMVHAMLYEVDSLKTKVAELESAVKAPDAEGFTISKEFHAQLIAYLQDGSHVSRLAAIRFLLAMAPAP